MNITSNFGHISNAQDVSQAGPRTIQMSLRFQFWRVALTPHRGVSRMGKQDNADLCRPEGRRYK
jgi:hypothetical protein